MEGEQFCNFSKAKQENPEGSLVYVWVDEARIRVDYGKTELCLTYCREVATMVAALACSMFHTELSPKSKHLIKWCQTF